MKRFGFFLIFSEKKIFFSEKKHSFFIIFYNIEKKKVTELKSIAKDFGFRRYSKLRKHELIQMIQDFLDNQRNSSNILDELVPEIKLPILQPTKFSVKK